MADKDILINIKSPMVEERLLISGGSAGGAITLAAIAAIQGKTLRKDVFMTGTIQNDHSIGQKDWLQGMLGRSSGAKRRSGTNRD